MDDYIQGSQPSCDRDGSGTMLSKQGQSLCPRNCDQGGIHSDQPIRNHCRGNAHGSNGLLRPCDPKDRNNKKLNERKEIKMVNLLHNDPNPVTIDRSRLAGVQTQGQP